MPYPIGSIPAPQQNSFLVGVHRSLKNHAGIIFYNNIWKKQITRFDTLAYVPSGEFKVREANTLSRFRMGWKGVHPLIKRSGIMRYWIIAAVFILFLGSAGVHGSDVLVINRPGDQGVRVIETIDPRILEKITVPTTPVMTPSPYNVLTIDSVPSGAELFLDSQRKGVTPKEVRIEPGSYTLLLKKAGYQDFSTTVDFVYSSDPSVFQKSLLYSLIPSNKVTIPTTIPTQEPHTAIPGFLGFTTLAAFCIAVFTMRRRVCRQEIP
jgi:hypothetical protein